MKKRVLFVKIVSLCLIMVIGITSLSVTFFAKEPTVETPYKTLSLGSNQLIVKNFIEEKDTALGRFKAPANGKYKIKAVNNGEVSTQYIALCDENLSEIEFYKNLHNNEAYTFKTVSLKKNEVIYFYADISFSFLEDDGKTLATKVIINQVEKKPCLNKTTLTLKKNKTFKLKLNNNNKKVIWVSANNKIASVTSKGVIKGKKKGVTYIYAIASHKLYKCKVTVK